MTLLDELERLLSAILDAANEKKPSNTKIGPIDVSSNVSVRVGLDEPDPARQPPALPDTEPLIDLIEKEGELKIVIYMPGIREEDAIIKITEGRLVVEVRKGLQVYCKDFSCNIGPQVVVKQTTLSNSVLEIVCKAKGESK